MATTATEGGPAGAGPRRARLLLVVLAAALSAWAVGRLAAAELFSRFTAFDDAGYIMLSVRQVLEGHPLYDDVYSQYGPFYYLSRWLVLGLPGLEVTHDVTGLVTLGAWVLTSALLALGVWRMTGSLVFTVLTQLQTGVVLRRALYEPGHPNDLAAVLLAGLVVAAAGRRASRGRAVALGALVAALTLTKINVGVFAGLGVLLAAGLAAPPGPLVAALRGLLSVLAVALPLVLMRQNLDLPATFAYAISASAAVLAALLVGRTAGAGDAEAADARDETAGSAGFGGLVLGGLVVVAVTVAFVLLRGTSPGALWKAVVVDPLLFPGRIHMPTALVPGWSAALAGSGVLLVARALTGGSARAWVIHARE